jgi:hypothetical protein
MLIKGYKMSEAILIWVYLSLDGLVTLSIVAISIFTAFVGVFFVINATIVAEMSPREDGYDTRWSDYRKMMKSTWDKVPTKTITLLMVIILAYPSKHDLKYIIGGSLVVNGVKAASDIEGVEKLPENLVNAMNIFLEKAVEETK